MYKTLLATLTATALSTVAVEAAPAVRAEPLDAATLKTIKSQFGRLMELANNHDFKAVGTKNLSSGVVVMKAA